jgi:Mrp family chromosome partitioning ATPase
MAPARKKKLVVTHGLADAYYSDIDLKDVIKSVNGVDVIFAGNLIHNQVDIVEIISSDKIRKQFQHLSKEYDFILVDSPCIKRYTDALTLNILIDGFIVVVEADRTPKRTLLMAINKIENAAGKIKGLVLNKQVNYVPELIQNFINSI